MSQLVNNVTRFRLKAMLLVHSAIIGNSSFKSFSNLHARTIVTTQVHRAGRLYTHKHEWIDIEGGVGTVGISNYAQDALGDVVFAQLPEVGSTIIKDDEVGALESVKAASELISPVSGKVIEKNRSIERKPGLINTSCYNEGWLYKVELSHPQETENLMNEKSYEEFLKSDPH